MKIKMKLQTFLFRYTATSATGLASQEVFQLCEFTILHLS